MIRENRTQGLTHLLGDRAERVTNSQAVTHEIWLLVCSLPLRDLAVSNLHALAETEDHINSFQANLPSPHHLKISGF